ncbi:MAG: small subunit ribosomal protein S5 [Patescibacteria group bacterium]|jgi:small subunit ribosomal protein S5
MVEEEKNNKKEEQEVVETVEEVSPEAQLAEMQEIVEEKETKEDEKVSKEADETFKREERRNLTPEQAREARFAKEEQDKLERWVPKTQLGRDVLAKKITSIDEVLNSGQKIMEPEIVDLLVPGMTKETLFIGQAKGKFGGGKRRPFRQTQKISKEGSSLTFGVMAVVGDGKGHIGLGYGRASETLPAKEKAFRKAKLNLIKIPRGCASYDCACSEEHSIPVAVEGKCSSVSVKLMPAPQGTGLVVGGELKKILSAVGIKDVYSKTDGKVRTTFNTAKACLAAISKLNQFEF